MEKKGLDFFMSENYSKLVVGEKYDRFKTEEVGVTFDWDNESGMIIVFRTNDVTDEFRNIFKENAPLDFRYCIIDNVCFFTVDVSGGRDVWNDFCFSTADDLYNDDNKLRIPSHIRVGSGIPLYLVGLNTHTGECVAIRQLGLPHGFSQCWLLWANMDEVKGMSSDEYNNIADRVYDKYDAYGLAKYAMSVSTNHSYNCYSVSAV